MSGDSSPPPRRPFRLEYFHVMGAIGFVAAAVSLTLAGAIPLVRKVVLSLWLVGPPIFFFDELHWVRKNERDKLADLKESQEAAARIWAGLAAVLALLYF